MPIPRMVSTTDTSTLGRISADPLPASNARREAHDLRAISKNLKEDVIMAQCTCYNCKECKQRIIGIVTKLAYGGDASETEHEDLLNAQKARMSLR